MSVVACELYRIEVAKESVLPLLIELKLMKVFEPTRPLFGIKLDLYQEILQQVTQSREKTGQAVDVLLKHTEPDQTTLHPVITPEISLQLQQKSAEYEKTVEHILSLDKRISSIEASIEEVAAEQAKLEVVKNVEVPIFAAQDLVKGRVLVVNSRYVPTVRRSLSKVEAIEYTKLAETAEATVLGIVYQIGVEESIDQLLAQPFCQEIPLPASVTADSPAQAYVACERQSQTLCDEKQQVINKIKKISKLYLADLVARHDLLFLQEDSLKMLEYVGYTPGSDTNFRSLPAEDLAKLESQMDDTASLISALTQEKYVHVDGWIDPSQVEYANKKLNQAGIEYTITKLNSADDPEARSVLKNKPFFQPFEIITNFMGSPHTRELDPSPYVAPFFILFFGFALGDAGYALLMIGVVAYFLMKKNNYSVQILNALYLMLYCAISTLAFGVVTGSWFGIDLVAIGSVGAFLNSLKVLNIQSNILVLLVASLAIGFIHQLFGLFLSVKNTWQQGRRREALTGPGTWLLLLMSIGLAIIVWVTPALSGLAKAMQWVLIGVVVVFALGQGEGSAWWLRPFKGMLSLFSITSYLSNTLSYARLIALALATGVIGSVVNMIAVMAGGDLPFPFSFIIVLLVAIIGHAFNIILSLMSTFINVARLHLVEFFPRFFEAKGTGLSPVHTNPAYAFFAEDFSTKDINFDQLQVSSNKYVEKATAY